MTEYAPQVDSSHYKRGSYRSRERWSSYWRQLSLVRQQKPETVLEVGPGEGVVTDALRKDGVSVTTLDISSDISPDLIGSITDLPLKDRSYDLVLCAEVLEHIRYEDVPKALAELGRVARKAVVISVPHPGYVFSLSFKLPLLPHVHALWQIPFFWETHRFNGEHYWELGKRGYPASRLRATAAAAGLRLIGEYKYPEDPVHRFFVFGAGSGA